RAGEAGRAGGGVEQPQDAEELVAVPARGEPVERGEDAAGNLRRMVRTEHATGQRGHHPRRPPLALRPPPPPRAPPIPCRVSITRQPSRGHPSSHSRSRTAVPAPESPYPRGSPLGLHPVSGAPP